MVPDAQRTGDPVSVGHPGIDQVTAGGKKRTDDGSGTFTILCKGTDGVAAIAVTTPNRHGVHRTTTRNLLSGLTIDGIRVGGTSNNFGTRYCQREGIPKLS